MITHLGQYWSPGHREVRLLAAAADGAAWDITEIAPLARARRRLRGTGISWREHGLTYERLPFPSTELFEALEAAGLEVRAWADGLGARLAEAPELDLGALAAAAMSGAPLTLDDAHLVAPVIPRRALAFGVTYLNSALERETEGKRADYGYVYRAVKERGERPELFLKGTSPEHFVGPGGRMGLRSDLTNSIDFEERTTERIPVSSGIEPELAAVVSSTGRIVGYTLADDVSGNRIENETLLYLTQAKYFTGCLVLGPLVWLSDEQRNPDLEIATSIFDRDGDRIFERTSRSGRINAPIADLVAWAASHIRLTPGEVISTGTDVVPDGRVKVLEEGQRVEIANAEIGTLRHGAAVMREDPPRGGDDLNLDYSRAELEEAR